MEIVKLDAIDELGHYILGETVQGLHTAGVLGVAGASITLKAARKIVGTEWWTRPAGHAAMMTAAQKGKILCTVIQVIEIFCFFF